MEQIYNTRSIMQKLIECNYSVINNKTASLRWIIFCALSLINAVSCSEKLFTKDECENNPMQLLQNEKLLNFQKLENELLEKRKELDAQLHILYLENQKLERVLNDNIDFITNIDSQLEHDVPSYCVNCIGESFEGKSKNSLSSEYSRDRKDEFDSYMQSAEDQTPQLSDHKRLESIKHQILLKLGLKNKPNISTSIPKQLIFDALQRSSGLSGNLKDNLTYKSTNHRDHFQTLEKSVDTRDRGDDNKEFMESLTEDDQEVDDFYGHTREIITFGERGSSVNGHHLIEFSTSIDKQADLKLSSLKIREATLWIMVETSNTVPWHNRKQRKDFLKLNQMYLEKSFDFSTYANVPLIKNTKMKNIVKKRKRKKREKSGIRFVNIRNNSANHINFDNHNDDHIIKNSYNKSIKRKLNQVNLAFDKSFNYTSDSHEMKPTIWVFSIKSNDFNGAVPDQEFDENAHLIVSKTIAVRGVGWQKIDITSQALGWDDWIIAPLGYYANYCSGSCGGSLSRSPDTFLTYYSHVFHEVRKYNKLNGNQLCCAPLKFSSMSLIYLGPDSRVIKRDLPKMVVDECGCP
ncbi:CLUMA_CG008005, isoform A [Clunio marinus]|uniref:CLUMA_CG008005, isoform A n=1 Tax=Clunio marinus TaxID=568069 RepID=A0A1J1I4I3_9DIPT|nr:CLUMA_CG008005, isoform A [Clunio marinus]